MRKLSAIALLPLLFFVCFRQVAIASDDALAASDGSRPAGISYSVGSKSKSHRREGRYQIVENNKTAAIITINETQQEITITVDRTSEPPHRFRYLRDPGLLVGEVGNEFIFTYVCSETLRNFKISDGKLPKLPLPGVTLGNLTAAKAYFSPDMPWLRLIAEIDPRSLFAECFYVLATKDLPDLKNSTHGVTINVQEKADLGNYQDCLSACRNLRESCVRNVPPSEITNCYLIEAACINNCSKVV